MSRGLSSMEVVGWWCGWQVVDVRGGLSRGLLTTEVVGSGVGGGSSTLVVMQGVEWWW